MTNLTQFYSDKHFCVIIIFWNNWINYIQMYKLFKANNPKYVINMDFSAKMILHMRDKIVFVCQEYILLRPPSPSQTSYHNFYLI